MKNLGFLVVGMVLFSQTLTAQPCHNKYKSQLEKSSELINCGANYTVELLKGGLYRLQRYHVDTEQLTLKATYRTEELTELHGYYEERWDDGQVVTAGVYAEGLKTGPWRESIYKSGVYVSGLKEGVWQTFDKDSRLIRTVHYLAGDRHGETIQYDSLGAEKLKEVYERGELISTTRDTSLMIIEEMPRFPGCEDQELDRDELQSCSQLALLQYVYGSLSYPMRSKELGIEGKALLSFTIKKDGSVSDIKILNGLAKDIEREISKLVRDMPQWRPGYQDGVPVDVQFTLPVRFKLR